MSCLISQSEGLFFFFFSVLTCYSMGGHRVVASADEHFYCATKYAVTALTEGIRQELREANTHVRATVSELPLWERPVCCRNLFTVRAAGAQEKRRSRNLTISFPAVYFSWSSRDWVRLPASQQRSRESSWSLREHESKGLHLIYNQFISASSAAFTPPLKAHPRLIFVPPLPSRCWLTLHP